jgi:type II secretory pathway pseudopilin PulG
MAFFAALLVLTLMLLFALPSKASSAEVLRQIQAAQATVSSIAQAADEVYLAGEGSLKTIWIEIPDGWQPEKSFIGNNSDGIDWPNRKILSLYIPNAGDIIAISHSPLCGKWPALAGKYQINITYNSTNPAHVMVNSNC